MKNIYSDMRKEIQASGEAPSWYNTGAMQMFMQGYSYNEESPKSRMQTIAKALAKHAPLIKPDFWETDPYTKGKTWEQVFFNVMWDGFIGPSTPLMRNGGIRSRGTTVSCSSGYMGNNIFDRYNILTEGAVLTKHSHGTSYSINDWPSEGTPLKKGGFSKGVMPIIKDLIDMAEETTQGGRRGSVLYSLGMDHGDFPTALEYAYQNPESNNPAWLLTDEFCKRILEEEDEASKRFLRSLQVKLEKGRGNYSFIDKMNRHLAAPFKDKGMTVKSSNLCVAPETLLFTSCGPIQISTLEGQTVDVWNGEEWSETVVCKTGTNQPVVKVYVMSKGNNNVTQLECTHYHKWYLKDGKCVETRDLKSGDELLVWHGNGNVFEDVVLFIEDEGVRKDTYCVTEPKRHMAVFNGILTGQCMECVQPSDDEFTYSCVILNYNLEVYDKWPKHLIWIGQIMSDCNISEYLECIDGMSIQDQRAMQKIKNYTKQFRPLGSGVVGWHTLMQRRRIVVGSLESMYLNTEIFKRLDQESKEATQWLAKVLGEPEGCKGYGIRNATRLMMPPTKSCSDLLAGASEGIGLDLNMVFTKQSAAGEIFRVNKVLVEIMKERGKFNNEEIMKLAKNRTVKGCGWLDEHEEKVFRNAFEVPQDAYLRLCSQRQRYIDQGQSINLYFTSADSPEYIGKIHRQAIEDENILNLYYIYSMRGTGSISRSESCENCQ